MLLLSRTAEARVVCAPPARYSATMDVQTTCYRNEVFTITICKVISDYVEVLRYLNSLELKSKLLLLEVF